MSAIYYCTKENNTCIKKEECKRYINKENDIAATLYKAACTDQNNYLLFIKSENNENDNGRSY